MLVLSPVMMVTLFWFVYEISGQNFPILVTVIAASYCALRVAILASTRHPANLLMIFHLFILSGTLIPIIVQVSRGYFRYDFVSLAHFDFVTPFSHLLAAILVVDLVYWLTSRRQAGKAGYQKQAIVMPVVRTKTAFIFLLIGVFYILLALRNPGLEFFTSTRLDQYLDYELPPLIFAFATFFIRIYFALAALLCWSAFRWNRKQGRSGVLEFLLLLCSLSALAIFMYPLSTPRMIFFGLALFALQMLGMLNSRIMRWGFAVAFFLGFYVVFPLLGTASRSPDIIVNSGFDQIASYMAHPDLDNAIMYVVGYSALADIGFMYGKNVLSAALAFLPRSIWEGKSEGLGSFIIQQYGDYFTNISSPYFLEWYADFGLFGVILGAAILGYIIAKLKLRQTSKALSPIQISALANAAMFATIPILLRGSMLTGTIMLFCFAGVIMHVWIIAKITRNTASGRYRPTTVFKSPNPVAGA